MRVFRDEDGEYLCDTQLDLFDSDEDVGGDIFEDGDDDGNELVEIDVELRAIRFCCNPLSLVLAPGFSLFVIFKPCVRV
jgi:hypothetical protein